MRRLVQMSAQPANDYYAWQTEVYLDNFLGLGYNGNNIEVIAAYIDFVPDSWINLQQKYPHVRFFFYLDEMGECNYPPAIQAHILKKHFKSDSELSKELKLYRSISQEKLGGMQANFEKTYGTADINIQDGTINYQKENEQTN